MALTNQERKAPIFYWNGIKEAKGAKLQRCSYSNGPIFGPDRHTLIDCITIYGRDYHHFSAAVLDHFKVENDTDYMTDYFEEDRIRVFPTHPLYPQVKAAMEARDAHYARRAA